MLPRTRLMDTQSPSQCTSVQSRWTNGVPEYLDSVTVRTMPNRLGVYSSMSDYVVENYHELRQAGRLLPVNPMQQTRVDHYHLYGDCRVETLSGVGNKTRTEILLSGDFEALYWGSIGTPTLPSVPVPDWEAAYLEAFADAKAKSLDATTFLLELGKTTEMIAGATKRWSSYIEGLLKSNSKADLAKLLSGAWMEGRYGWRTLAYDAESIKEALLALQEHPYISRSSRTVSNTARAQVSTTGAAHWNTGLADFLHTHEVVVTQHTRAGALVEKFFQNAFQTDIPVTLWEIIPASFVVDWFISIGDWIQAWTPRVGENTAGWRSLETKTERIRTTRLTSSPYYQAVVSGSNPMSMYTRTHRVYERFKVDTLPLPQLRLKFDAFKLIDSIALAIQVKTKLVRQLKTVVPL